MDASGDRAATAYAHRMAFVWGVVTDELELLNRALAGRYRVSREIGRGGMATVYRAHDLKHDRAVALKVLKPQLAAALGTERFLREIAVTARLDHVHILPLLDSGEARGLLYYVMPYVEGESLRDRLDREKQLPLEDALEIAREVADALGYAQSQGIVHRDIKPENILLGGGHARVADFGIARAVRAAGDASLTETGLAVGTPAYMSPEQASGEREVDPRADVYSLGCILYEMLAGQPPYTGATFEAILARKALEPVPSLRVVRNTVPLAIEQAVAKALARVPADRFASARQFAEALESARATASPPVSAWSVWRFGAGMLAVAAAVATLITDVGGLRTRLTGGAAGPKIESLAVLPLENLSGDPEQDYLAAGMHEALITKLGKLGGLRRVSARPSVLRYQKTDKPLRQIADELGVSALIIGTVLRSGDNVRITAHLIDGATEEPIWGDGYEREVRDVLVLHNEIVADIARQVQLQLSPDERAGLGRARQVDPEAYEAYLKGKFLLNTFTPEGFERGMALLREAVAIDPAEPLAYAGLAHGYTLMELFSPASSADDVPRAKAAAERAVTLDETLAEAHVALAMFRGAKEWDYASSEESVRRALRLNPNLAEAHVAHAQHLSIFGSQAEAIAEWKRGIDLDPLSPLYTAWFAGAYWEFGRFDDAIAEARKALVLQPDFPVALAVLGYAHLDKGQYQEAIATHEKLLEKYPNQGFSWVLARTYALSGRAADARRIMASLESGAPGDLAHPWFIAAAYAALGNDEQAMDWLEKAYDARILFLSNLARERAAGFDLRGLRGNPRFRALLRRVNLPE
jgi:serine/threonine-protein kinase